MGMKDLPFRAVERGVVASLWRGAEVRAPRFALPAARGGGSELGGAGFDADGATFEVAFGVGDEDLAEGGADPEVGAGAQRGESESGVALGGDAVGLGDLATDCPASTTLAGRVASRRNATGQAEQLFVRPTNVSLVLAAVVAGGLCVDARSIS
jgi:hypothetical protein